MLTYRNTIAALLVGAAISLSSTPAMADPDATFTGPYVAAIGGWDRVQGNKVHKDGFLYGGQAGYDIAAGKVRFGPEVEVTGSTEKGCISDDGEISCAKAGRDLFAGGRIGYVVTPKALVYVAGGYTNARYDTSVSDAGAAFSDDKNHSGGRVGAGVEYAVTKNMFVKTEYRYSRYSDSISRNQVIGGIGVRF
jgi:outer membrane immunogenic protein